MSGIGLCLYRLAAFWTPESRFFALRRVLLRWAGVKIGSNVRIYSSARIIGNGMLELGDDVHIGPETMIYVSPGAKVTIGSHVDIAPRVTILTGSHEVDPAGEHLAGKGVHRDIEIADGCWIGAKATLLGGTTLGARTLVAAGAVVTGTKTDGLCLLAGVPAKVVKWYGRID